MVIYSIGKSATKVLDTIVSLDPMSLAKHSDIVLRPKRIAYHIEQELYWTFLVNNSLVLLVNNTIVGYT